MLIDTGVGTANYADFVLEFLAKQLGEERPPLLVINTHCQPGVLLFERGNFSLTVKKTDPGVRPAGAMLSPRADRC